MDLDAGLPEEFATGSIMALKMELEEALTGCDDGPESEGHVIKAVTCLKNGGLLMELGSDKTVGWFASDDIRKRFLARLHPDASIKNREYHTVMQFVPLTFKPDRDVELREVEAVNGLGKGAITCARWIKPVARRSPSQTCGHAIFSFLTPTDANEVLANGIFVQQKKVYLEK